jgi:FkbM family methyltransferase
MQVFGYATWTIRFRGFWRIANILGRVLFRETTPHIVQLGEKSKILVDLRDPYWSRIIVPVYRHEPELGQVLRSAADAPFVFIDCGANIGYWSILATDPSVGCVRAIAVEAMPDTYELLSKNRALNQGRFQIINRAVYSTSGDNLYVCQTGDSHASARLSETGKRVTSITVDDVADILSVECSLPVVVKLDIEGAEIQALKGMSRILARDCLIIYEDHGAHIGAPVTRYVLEEMLLDVFYVDAKGGVCQIFEEKEAVALKKNRRKGYNFVATHNASSWWRKLSKGSLV